MYFVHMNVRYNILAEQQAGICSVMVVDSHSSDGQDRQTVCVYAVELTI